MNDQHHVVRYFTDQDIDDVCVDEYNIFSFALYVATRRGHLKVVRTLLESKPYAILKLKNDGLGVVYASEMGHLELLCYLVEEQGANLHAREENALKLASSNGHVEVVRYILKRDGTRRSYDRNLALEWACNSGHLEVVQLLCSVAHANGEGYSIGFPLYYACNNGHIEIVRHLVERGGADVRVRDEMALMHVAPLKGRLNIFRYLVEHGGSDVYAQDGEALRLAVVFGRVEVVNFVMKHEGDNMRSSCFRSILNSLKLSPRPAAAREHHGVLRFLMDHKKEILEYIIKQDGDVSDYEWAEEYHVHQVLPYLEQYYRDVNMEYEDVLHEADRYDDVMRCLARECVIDCRTRSGTPFLPVHNRLSTTVV